MRGPARLCLQLVDIGHLPDRTAKSGYARRDVGAGQKGRVMDIGLCKTAASLGVHRSMGSLRPLDRAKAISGLVSEEALAGERLGRLTDRVAAAMLDANLFAVRLPRDEGGLGGTGVELFEATEEIARADGSAGWCMLISNAVGTFIHIGADPEARCEIFGNGPVACWATLLPKARSVAIKGGFRLSGNFSWGSSSSLSRCVMVAEPIADRGGRQWFRAHLVPKEDVEIREGSWDVMGLRATASVDYTITDKFVPAHRTFEYPFLSDGDPRRPSARGLVELGRPGMAAFASGIGLRALDELLAAAPKTKRLQAEGMQSEDNVVQFGIGDLEGRLRAARGYCLDLVA